MLKSGGQEAHGSLGEWTSASRTISETGGRSGCRLDPDEKVSNGRKQDRRLLQAINAFFVIYTINRYIHIIVFLYMIMGSCGEGGNYSNEDKMKT